MTNLLWASLFALLILTGLCLYRAAIGPTVADRMVAINVISTKTVVLVVGISIVTGQAHYVDVALVYGLIGFLATIGVAIYLEHSGRGGSGDAA
jgi:multicomponent Na+:H+ antiporter subunit F